MTTGTSDDRMALRDLIRARSLQTGSDIQLASGRVSNFYFNMKPTMLHPEGARLIGTLILDAISGKGAAWIGGLEMGAVPIASAVAAVSAVEDRPINAFFVRKAVKNHGTKSLIEGLSATDTLSGARVVVVEDVTTTGGSALQAVDLLKAQGCEIVTVITVVDRQEGAGDAFKAAGVPFEAILTASDFA